VYPRVCGPREPGLVTLDKHGSLTEEYDQSLIDPNYFALHHLPGSESGGGHLPAGFFASSGPAIGERAGGEETKNHESIDSTQNDCFGSSAYCPPLSNHDCSSKLKSRVYLETRVQLDHARQRERGKQRAGRD
jgi:hypothetical protein